MFETGASSFVSVVEDFVNFILSLVSAFLALFGFDASGSTESESTEEESEVA